MATILTFDRTNKDQVALIVRGKSSATHEPKLNDQHADVILPNGEPVGYFGEGGGVSGWVTQQKVGILKRVVGAMRMEGGVYGYNKLAMHRPHFVDGTRAQEGNVYSTVLVVSVTKQQGIAFENYWSWLAMYPGKYRLLGKNCSSRAADAFIQAGIIKGSIPRLDTPNNLYKHLVKKLPDSTMSYSGFVDIQRATAGVSDYIITVN
jgi:hypothetical protein